MINECVAEVMLKLLYLSEPFLGDVLAQQLASKAVCDKSKVHTGIKQLTQIPNTAWYGIQLGM
jgi:hypothetical protein